MQGQKALDNNLANMRTQNEAVARDARRFEQREKLLLEVCHASQHHQQLHSWLLAWRLNCCLLERQLRSEARCHAKPGWHLAAEAEHKLKLLWNGCRSGGEEHKLLWAHA